MSPEVGGHGEGGEGSFTLPIFFPGRTRMAIAAAQSAQLQYYTSKHVSRLGRSWNAQLKMSDQPNRSICVQADQIDCWQLLASRPLSARADWSAKRRRALAKITMSRANFYKKSCEVRIMTLAVLHIMLKPLVGAPVIVTLDRAHSKHASLIPLLTCRYRMMIFIFYSKVISSRSISCLGSKS